MNILILGSGGREHALSWKISQSPSCTSLYIAPGNGGTSAHGSNLDIQVGDFDGIVNTIQNHAIDMVVVGPEIPLVDGLKEYLQDHLETMPIFVGPGKSGAILEGSKAYSKEFMKKYKVPTAAYGTFSKESLSEAKAFLSTMDAPYVLKADGLAAGKGVLIINDLSEAEAALDEMFSGKFGDASSTVVIEEFLDGIEFSVFTLIDGKNYVILPEAKDYKRIGEGDTGLNTGGMGAISPVPFVDATIMEQVKQTIIEPTIAGINAEKLDYKGFIFFGLIKVGDTVKVIEYNCRLGDPETEAIMPRISSDLVPILASLADQTLDQHSLEISDHICSTVMMVSGGYPEAYNKGKIINFEHKDDDLLFHAGTKEKNGNIVTNGGRVLSASAVAHDMQSALDKSYDLVNRVSYDQKNYRTDIGKDLLSL